MRDAPTDAYARALLRSWRRRIYRRLFVLIGFMLIGSTLVTILWPVWESNLPRAVVLGVVAWVSIAIGNASAWLMSLWHG